MLLHPPKSLESGLSKAKFLFAYFTRLAGKSDPEIVQFKRNSIVLQGCVFKLSLAKHRVNFFKEFTRHVVIIKVLLVKTFEPHRGCWEYAKSNPINSFKEIHCYWKGFLQSEELLLGLWHLDDVRDGVRLDGCESKKTK